MGMMLSCVKDVDYIEEGRRLLQAVNLGDLDSAPHRYSPCDPLWRHPRTGAVLYVGNASTASNRASLRKYEISRIVNCQDHDGRNYFEGDPELQYLRFGIGMWRTAGPGVLDGAEGTRRFWAPYVAFVAEALLEGRNVLVHCLAGAHRAGTAGIAALMLLCGWDAATAIARAKQLRPAIEPIGGFPELLRALERAGAGREPSFSLAVAVGVPLPPVDEKRERGKSEKDYAAKGNVEKGNVEKCSGEKGCTEKGHAEKGNSNHDSGNAGTSAKFMSMVDNILGV